jgi:hypothetical protein
MLHTQTTSLVGDSDLARGELKNETTGPRRAFFLLFLDWFVLNDGTGFSRRRLVSERIPVLIVPTVVTR